MMAYTDSGKRIKSLSRLVLLLLSIIASIVAFAPLNIETYGALDASHLPAFGIFTVAIFFNVPELHKHWRYTITLMICVSLVFAVEWIQTMVGRTASWEDSQLGLIGIALALTGIYTWRHTKIIYLRGFYSVGMLLVLSLFFYPVVQKWYDASPYAHQAYIELAQFINPIMG